MEFKFAADRDGSGVRIRRGGNGDEWADLHRKLGTTFNMQDLDAIMGHVSFAKNTTDQLFVEYVPDRWENRNKLIREFAIVAMFDRKNSRQAMFADIPVSTALQLQLCRTIAKYQPEPPMFFFVVACEEGFEMIRLDIETAEEKAAYILPKNGEWRTIWESAGLISLRNKLRLFAESKAAKDSVFRR